MPNNWQLYWRLLISARCTEISKVSLWPCSLCLCWCKRWSICSVKWYIMHEVWTKSFWLWRNIKIFYVSVHISFSFIVHLTRQLSMFSYNFHISNLQNNRGASRQRFSSVLGTPFILLVHMRMVCKVLPYLTRLTAVWAKGKSREKNFQRNGNKEESTTPSGNTENLELLYLVTDSRVRNAAKTRG